jgi:hypothetical protein
MESELDLNRLEKVSGLRIKQNDSSSKAIGFEWQVVYKTSQAFEGSLQACKAYCRGYLAGLLSAWPPL